jgi:hypothetical protein
VSWVLLQLLSVVLEDPPRRIVQVVELPVLHGLQEEDEEHGRECDRDRDEEDERVHAADLRTAASTRDAPHTTIADESGMSTAATSGFTHPAAAAVTAVTLYPMERI